MGDEGLDDTYKVLQVDPSAELEVIEAAYRRLARKYHPDVNRSPDAAERMKELNAAYNVLKDPARRAAYDRQRAVARSRRIWERPPARPEPTGARAEPAPEPRPQWQHDRPPCWKHATLPAVESCHSCGVTLCRWCALLFQPAGCAPCVLRLARRVQRRAAVGLAIFGFAFLFGLYVAGALAHASFSVTFLAAYLVAATSLGVAVIGGRMWRTGWMDQPEDWGIGVTFLVWAGLILGWLGAPLLLAKMGWDLGRGRRLAATARAALDVR